MVQTTETQLDFRKLYEEMLLSTEKILVVGGSTKEYHQETKKDRRFVFMCLDSPTPFERSGFPPGVKYIVIHPSAPGAFKDKVERRRPVYTTVIKFPASFGALGDILHGIQLNKPLSPLDGECTEIKADETKSLQQVDIGEVLDDTQPKKRCPRGTLPQFIIENVDPIAVRTNASQEMKRLYGIAVQQGITTSLASLHNTYYALRRDGKILKINTNQAPITTSEEKNEERVPSIQEHPPVSLQDETVKRKTTFSPENLPSDAIPAENTEWHNNEKSVCVSFYPNRLYKSADDTDSQNTIEALLDRSSRRGHEQRWIGYVTTRSETIPVFTDTGLLDLIIDLEYDKIQVYPVDIPCYIRRRERCWEAIGFDHERLRKKRLIAADSVEALTKRIERVESALFQIMDFVRKRGPAPQDMLVVIDYQNLEKRFEESSVRITKSILSEITDRASRHLTQHAPRRIVRIVVVDFNKPVHAGLENQKFFQFFEVPNPQKVRLSKNPTDQYLYQAVLFSLDECQKNGDMPPGSLVSIVSGDSDFVPLIHDLARAGYETMVSGHPKHTSEKLRRAATYVMDIVPTDSTQQNHRE